MNGTTANTPLALALAAAAHGFQVLPLTRAKLPAVRSPHPRDLRPTADLCRGECGRLGHGVHDATADPEAVRALFAAAPWATGYGIACGLPPHHLVGIDLDVRPARDGASGRGGPGLDGPGPAGAPGQCEAPGRRGTRPRPPTNGPRELARLERLHAFATPATVTVMTPGGGRHLWLSGPPGRTVPNSAGRVAPGIDIRGSGGYLVGPGSRGRHGAYRRAAGCPRWDPAPVPPPLLALIAPRPSPLRRSAPASGPTPATALLHFVRASVPGERNSRLFWAACRAYETGGGEALALALVDAAVATGLPHAEAHATVTSAARHHHRVRR